MATIRGQIRDLIKEAVEAIRRQGVFSESAIPDFSVESPDDSGHGDYATNAALVIAQAAKINPKNVTAAIAEQFKIHNSEFIVRVQVAGPGFLNIWISDRIKKEGLKEILSKGANYGRVTAKAEKIQVEFISANPTGPLTLANGRGGFLGDVLAKVLETQGHEVEREYYLNDSGNQIKTLGFSLLAAVGLADDSGQYYHGGYLEKWVEANRGQLQSYKSRPESLGRLAAADFLETLIRPSVEEKMKIKFGRWTSEFSDIIAKGYPDKLLKLARDRELVFETQGATWMKTTDFGDDKDRVLITKDGEPTYFFVDAGHYFETKERGFDKKINIVGADHHGYVRRIQAAARVIGLDSVMIVMQLVRLFENGKEARMSKRAGVYITIDELIDEVGLDQVRYFFLEKNPETHIDFDLELAKKRSRENPVFYIQYAHARLSSLTREGLIAPPDFDFGVLDSDQEKALIRQLLLFPDILGDIARDHRVSRLVRYAYGLAHTFHLFYDSSRVLDVGEPERSARMALASATAIVLKKSLSLLGITAPEEM